MLYFDLKPKSVWQRFTWLHTWRGRAAVAAIGSVLFGLLWLLLVWATNPGAAAVLRQDAPSQVYSADGVLLFSYQAEQPRLQATDKQLGRWLRVTAITLYDPTFNQHGGVRLTYRTITHQLAASLLAEYAERKGRNFWFLRLRQMLLALALESRHTKEEIMTMYLNRASYGGTLEGIVAASDYYFGRKPEDLKPEEAVLLVSILKAPSHYHPKRQPNNAFQRRNQALDILAAKGEIAKSRLQELKAKPLGVLDDEARRELAQIRAEAAAEDNSQTLAPYFKDYLRRELTEWCKANGHNLYRDGLTIRTTLDSRMQRHAEEAVRRHLREHQARLESQMRGMEPWKKDSTILLRAMRMSDRYQHLKAAGWKEREIRRNFDQPRLMKLFSWKEKAGYIEKEISPWDSLIYYAPFLETGMLALDSQSGQMKAYVGGIDYQFFKYDHVSQGRRQVGSTFKPFVYTTALLQGKEPCSTTLNQPVTIVAPDGDVWRPMNADGDSDSIPVSYLRGLQMSINVVTARIMDEVGAQKVIDLCRKMGVESPLEPVPALSLGVCDLTVAELAGAYTCYPSGGVYRKPYAITSIEDEDGAVLAGFKAKEERVFDEQLAYTMVQMLRNVVNRGTGGSLRWRVNLPWYLDCAGKTGTTQGNSDGWFSGFTRDLTASVWVGCSDRNVRFARWSQDGRGSHMAMPIWGYFMKAVYEDSTLHLDIKGKMAGPEGFTPPEFCPLDPPIKVPVDTLASDTLRSGNAIINGDTIDKRFNGW